MYGTQAKRQKQDLNMEFENDVKMYGTQATRRVKKHECEFENDVKMYGIQAYPHEVKGAG